MKKYTSIFIIIFLVVLNTTVQAQDSTWKAIARGQNDYGHWLVESNKELPDTKLVSFYTKDNKLMYKEEVKSTAVNMKKERSYKRLEQLLTSIAQEWERSKAVAGRQLVYHSFE